MQSFSSLSLRAALRFESLFSSPRVRFAQLCIFPVTPTLVYSSVRLIRARWFGPTGILLWDPSVHSRVGQPRADRSVPLLSSLAVTPHRRAQDRVFDDQQQERVTKCAWLRAWFHGRVEHASTRRERRPKRWNEETYIQATPRFNAYHKGGACSAVSGTTTTTITFERTVRVDYRKVSFFFLFFPPFPWSSDFSFHWIVICVTRREHDGVCASYVVG